MTAQGDEKPIGLPAGAPSASGDDARAAFPRRPGSCIVVAVVLAVYTGQSGKHKNTRHRMSDEETRLKARLATVGRFLPCLPPDLLPGRETRAGMGVSRPTPWRRSVAGHKEMPRGQDSRVAKDGAKAACTAPMCIPEDWQNGRHDRRTSRRIETPAPARYDPTPFPSGVPRMNDPNQTLAAIVREAVPLAAFFDETGTRPNPETVAPLAQLTEADVVFAVDVMTQRPFLVYGREVLTKIATSGVTARHAVLAIAVDVETDELERLIALLVTVKGRHDYGGAAQSRP